MAVYDLEEQEQISELKAWWAQYGNLVVTLAVVAALASVGWQAWNWYQNRNAGEAGALYYAVQQAAEIIEAGYIVDWAPVNHNNRLHDRASYRFYWHVLERAHATGKALPCGVQALFSGQGAAPQPPHTPW